MGISKKGISTLVLSILLTFFGILLTIILYKAYSSDKSLLEKKLEELHKTLENQGKILLVYNPTVNIKTADGSRSYALYYNLLKEWLNENGIAFEEISIEGLDPNNAPFLLLQHSNKMIFYSWACSETDKLIIRKYVEGGGNLVMFSSCFLDSTGTSINIDQQFYQDLFGFRYVYVEFPYQEGLFYIKDTIAKELQINVIKIPRDFFNPEVMMLPTTGDALLYLLYNNQKYGYAIEDNKGVSKTLYIDDKFLELYLNRQSQGRLYNLLNLLILYSIVDALSLKSS